MTAIVLKDFERWPSSITQASLPANNNAARLDVLNRPVISTTVTAEPGSPASGDLYALGATHTGTTWATFANYSLAYFLSGTWYEYTPYEGLRKYSSATNTDWLFDGTWVDTATIDTSAGRHSIPVMASAMQPSVTGGCAALAVVASAANQPDILTLDFDSTNQEFAQFSIPMPKSWDEGTVTFKPIWSHDATVTNFGVYWTLQAVAVSNDDTILTNFGTLQSSTDTGGTTNDIYMGPESSAITVGGSPASEDIVFFRLSRDPTNGSDTLAIDARLHSIVLYITTNAQTDA